MASFIRSLLGNKNGQKDRASAALGPRPTGTDICEPLPLLLGQCLNSTYLLGLSPRNPIRAPNTTETLGKTFRDVRMLVEAIEERRPLSPRQRLKKPLLKEDAQRLLDSLDKVIELLSQKEPEARALDTGPYNRESKAGESTYLVHIMMMKRLTGWWQPILSRLFFASAGSSDFRRSSH
jgi:hypothetical protein